MLLARRSAARRLSCHAPCRRGPLDLRRVRTVEWNDRAARTLARKRHDVAVGIQRQILKHERRQE